MILIISFFILIFALNVVPEFLKLPSINLVKRVKQILLVSTTLVSITLAFRINNYTLVGTYTTDAFVVIFHLSCATYFMLVPNSVKKIITSLFLVIMMLLTIMISLFGRVKYELELDDDLSVKVQTGGIMACGDQIILTKSQYLIFEKQVHYEGALCLRNIEQIEVVDRSQDLLSLKIYHDGEYDSENPYFYQIDRKEIIE